MRFALALAFALVAAACNPKTSPQTGSQTNWLLGCETSAECATGLECVCGVCTATCLTEPACADLPGASCVAADHAGAIALCSGKAPPINLCLPRCDDSECGEGMSCVAGVCQPTARAPLEVTVDPEVRYQTLVGFGASVAYSEDRIVSHSEKEAIYDAFFRDAGLNVLRIRNRYEEDAEEPLKTTSELVARVTEHLGRRPVLFLNSASPPEELKANGSRRCNGDATTCTLTTRESGEFDYRALANHWRASLEAYLNANLRPDYLSIQSHPNWIAPQGIELEACLFLPEEGKTTVTVDDEEVEVTYPGYREALAEVRRALAELPETPLIAAPETGLGGISDFVSALDTSSFDAIAFHGYGADASSLDPSLFQAVGELGARRGRPTLLTEMQTEGIETAVLMHFALTSANATAYLQNDLVVANPDNAGLGLALLTDDTFELVPNYYVFSHFSKPTAPGFVRVAAQSSSPELLVSAWLAPDQRRLALVLVNPGESEVDAKLALPEPLKSDLKGTLVTRTVFDGLERAASLGALPPSGIVSVPGRSIATVSFERD